MNKRKLSPIALQPSPMTKRSRMMNLAHSVDHLKLPIKQKKNNVLKPIELIPKDYNDRIDYLKKLFEKQELMPICTNAPLRISSKSEDVGAYMASKITVIPELLAALIIYMNINFAIDTDNLNSKHIPDQSAESIFKSGCGLGEGLARLYQSMAGGANIRLEIVVGQFKPSSYKPGEPRLKHYWCCVKILSSYYLIDPSMAIGYIDKDHEFIPYIRPYYFLTPSYLLIDSHKPELDKFQFLEKPIQNRMFADAKVLYFADFYCNIFKYNIMIYNNPSFSNHIAIIDPRYVIKLSSPSYTIINLKLIKHPDANDIANDKEDNGDNESNNNDSKEDVVYENKAKIDIDDRTQVYTITITFPVNGDYTVVFNGRKVTGGDNDELIELIKMYYNVTMKKKRKEFVPNKDKLTSSSDRLAAKEKKMLSKCASEMDIRLKQKCYDNKGAYLFEPKFLNLRIGHETRFRVKVKDAISVVVLDGRKWNFLKTKEDSIYEGSVMIHHPSVVICCLKNTNVFTEVFEFSASKQ